MRRVTLCVLLIWHIALSQNPTGQITGRLLDPAGSVIPNGRIIAINNDTGVRTPTVSNGDGNYQVRNLIPGVYQLEVPLVVEVGVGENWDQAH